MKVVIAALLILVLPLQASAQNPAPQNRPPLPLDAQERIDQVEAVAGKLATFDAQLTQQTAEKKRGCVRAIGNESFCHCIIDSMPWVMTFPQYVAVLSASKDELNYDGLSAGDKKVIDAARVARDKCVNAKPVNVVPAKK